MESWPSKLKNNLLPENNDFSLSHKHSPGLIIQNHPNHSCQNNPPKILTFSYQHRINPPSYITICSVVGLYDVAFFWFFSSPSLMSKCSFFLQGPFLFSPYLTWPHPLAINAIFIPKGLKFITLVQISLLSTKLIYPTDYSLFPLGCFRGISNLTYLKLTLISLNLFYWSFSPL